MELMSLCLCLSLALLIRWAVSTFPYSGKNVAPMFGDYEAQRHWQEITVNLPPSQWYKNSSNNDLLYWGLDYPPLTAYHSWIVGKIGMLVNKSWVELHSSRGFESYEHKLFMRYSVLLSDACVYIPSVIFYCSKYTEKKSWHLLAALLFYPGLSLIDYGHFQYNCVSLGLFILAVALLDRSKILLGSVSFCLALNYKQMELYHAMPFFVFILATYLQNREPLLQRLCRVLFVGLVVIATFIVCWAPFLSSAEDALAVVQRLFPFSRGLFEDKVSNFWCSVNIVFKLKKFIPQSTTVTLCTITTLLSIVPSSIKLFLQPTMKNFKYSLVISSLGFFLFSYQVHEKTILVSAIAALLLIDLEPLMVNSFSTVSVFSMLPLLIKDGLLQATIATTVLFFCAMLFLYDNQLNNVINQLLVTSSSIGMIILTVCASCLPPPERLPDLWPVLISLYSCGHFTLFYIYFNYKLMESTPDLKPKTA